MNKMTFKDIIDCVNNFLRFWYNAVLRDRDGNTLRLWIGEDGDSVCVEYCPHNPDLFKGGSEEYDWDDELGDNICDAFGIDERSTGWFIDQETIRELKWMIRDTEKVVNGMEQLNKELVSGGENNG